MGKFSSQEIESQHNLIKMILAEPAIKVMPLMQYKGILNICNRALKT